MNKHQIRNLMTGLTVCVLILAVLLGLSGCGLGKQENPMIVVEAQDNSANAVRYDEKNPVVFSFVKEENAEGEVTYELASAKDEKGKSVDAFTLLSETNNRIQMKEGTPAGTYSLTIKVKAAGNDEYRSATKEIKYLFTVDKAESVMRPPTAIMNLKPTGSPQMLVTAGSSDHGTIWYRLDDGEWSTDIPSATDAGIYTVYYKLVGDDNHKDIKEAFLLVSIDRSGSSAGGSASYPSVSYYSGGSTSIYDIISKGTSIATRKPVDTKPAANVTVVYDGQRHENGYTAPAGVVVIGETGATNAGRYMAVYTPDITHCWPDGTVTPTTVILTIEKAEPTVVIDARELEYNGRAQKAFEPAQVEGGTILYSLDGKDYSTAVPSVRDVGEYTVYYKVLGDRNHIDLAGSVDVTMADGVLPKPFAEKTYIYNGLPHWPVLTGYDSDTMSYVSGGVRLAVNAGTYTFEIKLDDPDNYTWEDGTTDNAVITWTIEKAQGSIDKDPAVRELTYNGTPQKLIKGGDTDTGEMMYRLGQDGEYTGQIPEATDAGTYRIYYYSAGDRNHFDTQPLYVDAEIFAASPVIDRYPVAVDMLYTGVPITLVIPGESADGHFEYSVDGGEWSSDVPQAVGSGDYTVAYRFAGDGNHLSLEGDELTSRIRMNDYAQYDIEPLAIISQVYDGASHELVIPGTTSDGTVEYRMADEDGWSEEVPSATEAGTYYIFYRINGDENHNDTDPGILVASIAPAALTVDAPDQAFVFNGEFQGDPLKVTTVDGVEATVEYSVKDTVGYDAEVPQFRDVMTDVFGKVTDKKIYYRVSAPNHETEEGSYTLAILRRSYSIPYLDKDYFVYDGTQQGPAVIGFKEDVMTMSGLTSGTNAGLYRVRVTLKDTKNMEWADGSNGTKNLDWDIVRSLVEIPTVTDVKFVYDGTEHVPVIEGVDETLVRVSGDISATDAGKYVITFSLKDRADYRWSDGKKDDRTVKWTIDRAKVEAPYLSETEYTYNGTEQGPDVLGFDLGIMKLSGVNRAVGAGDYIITVELADSDNYVWAKGKDGARDLKWTINKAVVERPVIVERAFVYDGQPHSPVFEGFDEELMWADGRTGVTDATWLLIGINLKDPDNYQWPDGTSEEKLYAWWIDPMSLAIPQRTDTEQFVYDGSEHAPVIGGFDDTLMVMSGETSAVGAGEHTIVFELVSPGNYVWEGDDKWAEEPSPKTLVWTIDRASLAMPYLEEDSFVYSGDEIQPAIAGLTELMNVYGCESATYVGKYETLVELTDPDNYQWEDGSTEDLRLKWQITKAIIEVPYLESDELTYNGRTQVVNILGFDEDTMVLTGITEAMEVGSYSVKIDLADRDNYEWSGGNTRTKTLSWKIVKAKLDVPTLKNTVLTYNGEEQDAVLEGFDEDVMTIVSGTTKGTEAGSYSVTIALIDKENYEWNHWLHHTKDRTIEWEIVPMELSVPEMVDSDYVYDGTQKSANLVGFDPDLMELEGTMSSTDAGIFLVEITLKDNVNYRWDDGTTESQYVIWMIDRIRVDVPTLSEYTFTYDGTEQGPVVTGYDTAVVSLTGTFSATEVGEYVITADIIDQNNYWWNLPVSFSRGPADPVDISWNIEKAPVEFTAPEAVEGLMYTGEPQVLITPGYTEDGVIWYSTDGKHYSTMLPSGVDDRDYKIYYKITADENHEDVEAVKLNAVISPALISAYAQDQSYAYDGLEHGFGVVSVATVNGQQYTVRYGYSEGSCTKKDAPVMTDANVRTIYYVINADHHETYRGSYELCVRPVEGVMEVYPAGAEGLVYNFGAQSLLISPACSSTGTVLYSIDGTEYSEAIPAVADAGSYTVYCYSKGDVNHLDTPVISLPVTIDRLTVDVPVVTDTEYIYDGEAHRPTIVADNINSFGQGVFGSVFPGEFTFTYSLVDEDNMCWSDGTTAPREFGWRIYALDPGFTEYPTGVEADYTGYPVMLVNDGEAVGGTIVYSLDGENFVTAEELTATAAGMYPVYYKIAGDIIHNDSDVGIIYSQISPGQAAMVSDPAGIEGLTFTGEAQTLIVPGETNYPDAQVIYLVNGSELTSEVPCGTAVGSYVIQYMIPATANFQGTDYLGTIVVSIGRAENPVHAVREDTVVEKLPEEVKIIDVTEYTGLPVGETAFVLTGVDGLEDYTNLIAMDRNLIAVSNLLPEGEYVIRFTIAAGGSTEYEEKTVDTSIKVIIRANPANNDETLTVTADPADLPEPGTPEEGGSPEAQE